MRTPAFLTALVVLLLCATCFAQAAPTTYQGSTGRKRAVFVLMWDEAGRGAVSGYYYTVDRPGRRYELAGQNYKNGRLVLTERTGGEASAVIRLTKSVYRGRIRWSGMMYNTDGRKIPVTFTRPAR